MQLVFIEWRYILWIYLEQHFVQNVDQETCISSLEGPFYLVEVLAFFLKHLKQLLMRQLGTVSKEAIISADIHWVIAVPVGLSQLVQEAACLVSK